MSEALVQTDKLSSEALAFVKAGTPKPVATVQSPASEEKIVPIRTAPPVAAMPEAPVALATEVPPLAKPVRKAAREKEPEPAVSAGLVSMTFRLPAEIPAGLIRASADRKVKRVRPFTQQEIVADVLSQWLKKEGFMA